MNQFYIFIFCIFILFFTCGKSISKDLSNIEWKIIGPYENTSALQNSVACTAFYKDHLEIYGGEEKLTVLSSPALPENSGKSLSAINGKIDFGSIFAGVNWKTAYAYSEFESDGGEYYFKMGSDDGIRVWINGVLLLDHHVHRSLNPNDELFKVNLLKGMNKILVKVCQGDGGWEMSAKIIDKNVLDESLRKINSIRFTIYANNSLINEGNKINFRIDLYPPVGNSVKFKYSVIDSGGNEIISGKTESGIPVENNLPGKAQGVLKLVVTPDVDMDKLISGKFVEKYKEAYFLKGDAESIFKEYARKARNSSFILRNEKWTGLPEQTKKCLNDMGSTLDFLALRLEGSLHESLKSQDLRIKAVGFVDDIIAAMSKGPSSLAVMTGYRQMAYISVIDDSIQPYSLYIPEHYDPDKKYGLIVMVHGYSGEDHVWGTYIASMKPDDFLIVSCFGRGDMYYRSIGEQDVLDVMDRVLERYSVDRDKVYLIGNSMGGNGTWKLGTLFPDRFAAIVPISGWSGLEWLDNLGNVGTYIIHGEKDSSVSVHMDRNAYAKLKKLGYPVKYEEIKNGTHSTWTEWSVLHDPSIIFDYFRSYKKNPSPEKINVTIPYVRYGKHYWIRINELDTTGRLSTPSYTKKDPIGDNNLILVHKPGSLNAQRISKTKILVTTKRVNAFSIDLKLAGMDGEKQLIIAIDGKEIVLNPGRETVMFSKNKNDWGIDEKVNTQVRHDGGGIADIFTKKVIIVYGTQDNTRTQLLQKAAEQLSDWSWTEQVRIGVKIGKFKVMTDDEITDEHINSSNLILIGNPDENGISKIIAPVISDYYSDNAISINGKVFKGCGLCVVRPSPLNPEKLIAYMDLPRDFINDDVSASKIFFYFQFRFRNNSLSETGTYPGFSPDVMVLTRHPLRDAWSGWFDRNWENLRGR